MIQHNIAGMLCRISSPCLVYIGHGMQTKRHDAHTGDLADACV